MKVFEEKDFLQIRQTNLIVMRFFTMKVVNSSLTNDLTNPLMDKMKHKSVDMMDRLMEVPHLLFCILAFATIGFLLHICWKAETSRVQEWFCNGTSRQHRWRALRALHRGCVQEELCQKPASKMEVEITNKETTKEG